MTKADSEKAIRELSDTWYNGLPDPKPEHPSFLAFKSWLSEKGYSHYLRFRSVMGADYDAELWFDQQRKQMWRR